MRLSSAFVSYAWDNDEHRQWVLDLATRLRTDGVETILDQWHLVPGDQLPAFMETAVRESDHVLIVCTPRYKKRSNQREGGVGYEGDIIIGEVFTTRNERKFIPILRRGEWTDSAPTWLTGKYYIDLRGAPYHENQYSDLLTTLLGTRPVAPPVRVTSGIADAGIDSPSSGPARFEPIRIEGVVVDEIGTPRGDGTRGSALYSIPFRFSRRPPPEWAELFVRAWDHPSSYTTMHRPGIAQIYGDKVILERATVDEVEKYHRNTLLLAAEEANKSYAELEMRRNPPRPSSEWPWIVLLALVGGLLGGAIWQFFWRSLGGATGEPHGIAALLWPVVTNAPTIFLFWLWQRTGLALRAVRVDAHDVLVFLIGLALASWFFYDFPASGGIGLRHLVYAFPGSFFQREAVLVMLWTSSLALGGFLPLLARRLWMAKRDTRRSLSFLLGQLALVVGPTSLVVIIFVNIFPSGSYESARGILAGWFLRLGLILGLVLGWMRSTRGSMPQNLGEGGS
jgi:TIR domain-containing protein